MPGEAFESPGVVGRVRTEASHHPPFQEQRSGVQSGGGKGESTGMGLRSLWLVPQDGDIDFEQQKNKKVRKNTPLDHFESFSDRILSLPPCRSLTHPLGVIQDFSLTGEDSEMWKGSLSPRPTEINHFGSGREPGWTKDVAVEISSQKPSPSKAKRSGTALT